MTVPSNSAFCMKTMDLHAMDESMKSFCSALTSAVKLIHSQVKAAQFPPSDRLCHNIRPGDWFCIKGFRRKNALRLHWFKPQVLLTTNTAVKCEGRSTWVHASHCKKVSPPCTKNQQGPSALCGSFPSSSTEP